MFLAVFGTGLKNIYIAQGEFNPSLLRSSTLDLPPTLSSNPACSQRGSLYASLDRAVVWLVVAPASAHSHLSIVHYCTAACVAYERRAYRMCFVPDAPRTTQLYY